MKSEFNPRVSILIPAYNSESWIRDAIESALNQTWSNTEIIVVDDGSRDGTAAAAREYQSRGVITVTQANAGASTARNMAFSLSSGDYIQWLDADDLLDANKISHQLKVIAANGSDRTLAASAWGKFIYDRRNIRYAPNALWRDLAPARWCIEKLQGNLWMATQAWLTSRTLCEMAGPWDATLSMDDDGEYFARIVAASQRIVFVPESKSFVRQVNHASLSRGFHSHRKLLSQIRSTSLQISHARRIEDTPEMRAAGVRYLQHYFGYYYPEHADLAATGRLLARELGGELTPPAVSWRYRLIERILGPISAKKANWRFFQFKFRYICVCDWLWYKLSGLFR